VPTSTARVHHAREARLKVAHPELTFATRRSLGLDRPRDADPKQLQNPFVIALREGTAQHGITMFDIGEIGHASCTSSHPNSASHCGTTVAIGDSHTTTTVRSERWPGRGASEIAHILATQTCVVRKRAQCA